MIPNRRVGDDTPRKGIADGYLSLPELSAAKADRRESAQQEVAAAEHLSKDASDIPHHSASPAPHQMLIPSEYNL